MRLKLHEWKISGAAWLIMALAFPVVTLSCEEEPPPVVEEPPFLVGGDISLLDKINAYGGTYRVDGVEKDALEIFRDSGYNYARIRLFHTPDMEGATVQDLDYVLGLAGRIKATDLKLLLNFHYSDTWADPGKQFKPAAWEGLSFQALEDSVYAYTLRVMNAFADRGIAPDMVQPGNEISYGMLWPEGKLDGNTPAEKAAKWDQFARLVKAGISGIRESPGGEDIPVMIHVAGGGKKELTQWFFDNLLSRGVVFDVIGQSYYPWWHGTLQMLEENITFMTTSYRKDIVIVETAYQWKGTYPTGADYSYYQPYPLTPQGQHDFLKRLYDICRDHASVTGIFYWYPECIRVPQEAGLLYFDRSLFTEEGEALPGIGAWTP